VQAFTGEPVLDRILSQTKTAQLPPRCDTVLLPRQRRDLLIPARLATLLSTRP
jgi:hypothetical protein